MLGWPRTGRPDSITSSTKHQPHASPGWTDRISGWPLSRACALACRLGEESQQPTWPHPRQIRRWHHWPPIARHSSHPAISSGSSVIPIVSRWVQWVALMREP